MSEFTVLCEYYSSVLQLTEQRTVLWAAVELVSTNVANRKDIFVFACLSDTKTRLYSCSRWRNLLISEEAAIIVFFGQEKNCSAAHRAKNSIMSCNMLAAHIIVLLAALLVEDKAKWRHFFQEYAWMKNGLRVITLLFCSSQSKEQQFQEDFFLG